MRILRKTCQFISAFLLFTVSFVSVAVQCDAVFPTGAQGNSAGGLLTVNSNAHVLNVSSSVLPFANDLINANQGDSCVTDDCSASGSPAEAFSLPSFPSFSGGASKDIRNTTLGEGGNNTNAYGFLTAKSGTTNFSTNFNEYFIKGLTINGGATVDMRPGVYWIEQLTLNSGKSELNVIGNGTVYIYVKNSVVISSNTTVHSTIGGISGNAVLSLNVYGNLTLNSNSDLSGLIYVQGTTIINSNATLTGAISSGNLTLNSNATVDYQPTLINDHDFSENCTASPNNSSTELIAHFEFDQGTGQTANDTSGYNRHGTLGGSASINNQDPSWQCESTGFYMDFDKSENQRLTTPAFQPPEKGVVAFWMKIPSVPNSLNRIFGFGDGYEIRFDSGGVMYIDINKTGSNSSIRTSGAFTTTDTWTHFAFTTDVSSGDWAVYINGSLDNSGNETLTAQSAASLTMGGSTRNPNNQSLNGSLDDFRVYSGLLSAAEIAALAVTPPQECVNVHHYDITHSSQAFTCEVTNITIKACEDAACTLSSTAVSLEFQADNATVSSHSFTGSTTFSYANTTAETVTLSVANSSEVATDPLTCNSSSASGACDLEFVDAGFQFFGASVGDAVPDQEAETNFQNVNLRAIENNQGVCKAALQGAQTITFGFDCDSESNCLTDFAGITVTGDGSGEFTGNLPLTFNSEGIAPLTSLNYADAGRLTLSAESTSIPKILKGTGSVDVYPSYLKLAVQNTDLIYTGGSDNDLYTAGLDFTYSIGAYGAQNNLLPNYQSENLALKVVRDDPTVSGTVNGNFAYDTNKTISSTGSDFESVDNVVFSAGEYSFVNAYYSETGRVTVDVRDTSYLGNTINSQSNLLLGTFIPAYYSVNFETGTALENRHVNAGDADFTYIGQAMLFDTEPAFTIIPQNARDQTIKNYIYGGWSYSPVLTDLENVAKLNFSDTSGYTGSSQVVHQNSPNITDVISVFGKRVALNGTQVTYNKVDSNNLMFGPVSPFTASLDIDFLAPFFTDVNGVCYRDDYADTTCNSHTLSSVSGADLRFGRFTLKSTYGPETETQQVPFFVEYYQSGSWLVNTLDNQTVIDFEQANGHFILSKLSGDISVGDINAITSDGILLLGETDKVIDLFFNAPNKQGALILSLNPLITPSSFTWPEYLNYDWNNDGVICNAASCPDGADSNSTADETDYPSATISFGLFRGNDRIIQWREVFN